MSSCQLRRGAFGIHLSTSLNGIIICTKHGGSPVLILVAHLVQGCLFQLQSVEFLQVYVLDLQSKFFLVRCEVDIFQT